MFEVVFDILGAFVDPILGIVSLLTKYILLPGLGIAIVCGVIYALFCAIKAIINPPSPPPQETTPPNLRPGTEAEKQCKNCFYCGRNMSESGEGIAHLCTKHHTIISKYRICDDFISYVDIALGINTRE